MKRVFGLMLLLGWAGVFSWPGGAAGQAQENRDIYYAPVIYTTSDDGQTITAWQFIQPGWHDAEMPALARTRVFHADGQTSETKVSESAIREKTAARSGIRTDPERGSYIGRTISLSQAVRENKEELARLKAKNN